MKKEEEKPLFRTFYIGPNKHYAILEFIAIGLFIATAIFLSIACCLKGGGIEFVILICNGFLICIVPLVAYTSNFFTWNEFYPDRIVTRTLLKKEVNIVYLKNLKCIVSLYYRRSNYRNDRIIYPIYVLCDYRPLFIGNMGAHYYEKMSSLYFQGNKDEARLNPMTCVKTMNNLKINVYLAQYCPNVEIMSYSDYCKKNNIRIDFKKYRWFWGRK